MKKSKIFIAAAFVLAMSSAFVTKGKAEQAVRPAYTFVLKENITGCPTVVCGPTGNHDCKDLKIDVCTGDKYTGTLRRNI